MLPLERVRDILGPEAPQADSDLEAARDQALALANLLVELFRKGKKDR